MDVKERLVDDVHSKLMGLLQRSPYIRCEDVHRQYAVNWLMNNGVTVQDSKGVEIDPFNKWISVKDRLPQQDEPVGLICEQVQVILSDGFVTTGWCNRSHKAWYYLPYGDTHFIGDSYENTPVIAWQPLAQPPKGE